MYTDHYKQLFRYVSNQPPKSNSTFHLSGVGKWVPASAAKIDWLI